jgi:general stress protein YciG
VSRPVEEKEEVVMNPMLDPVNSPNVEGSSDEPKPENVQENPKPRRPRGFAAMDRSKVSEIASKGGKAAHAAGTAHQFTSDEARAAGKKGGVAPHVRRGRGPRQSTTLPTATAESTENEESKSA